MSSCTCQTADVTSIGDVGRTVLQIREGCVVHDPRLNLDDVPVVRCVSCGDDETVKRATWEEHDRRPVGWWCQRCRIVCGIVLMKPGDRAASLLGRVGEMTVEMKLNTTEWDAAMREMDMKWKIAVGVPTNMRAVRGLVHGL